jgi:hypothetical protein
MLHDVAEREAGIALAVVRVESNRIGLRTVLGFRIRDSGGARAREAPILRGQIIRSQSDSNPRRFARARISIREHVAGATLSRRGKREL